jgi:cytochrome c-type protein NapB
MKMKIHLISVLLLTLVYSMASAKGPIDETEMGIGQDGVFGEPTPTAFNYPEVKAGKSDRLDRAWYIAPPQVPHTIEKYLPITLKDNQCLDCHDRPKLIGKEYVKGKKLPMPESHYGGFKGKAAKDEVSGSRYVCSQCHVAQSGAQPLVENTYK